MQPLNDDMDELFRKAAADYPLKAGEGNWRYIRTRLDDAPSPSIAGSLFVRKIGFALLLLLIPGGLIFHNDSFNNSNTTREQKQIVTSTYRQEPARDHARPGHPATTKSPQPALAGSPVPAAQKATLHKIPFTSVPKQNMALTVASPETGRKTETSVRPYHYSMPAFHSPIREGNIAASVLHDNPLPTVPQSFSIKGETTNRKGPGIRKGLHVGVVAGLDLGTVKGQSFTKAGHNIGVLGSYRFNKRLSFETGVLWIKKNYYSSGEHFSMSKIGPTMPGGMEMVSVKGQLSTIEIPYKLRYDFLLQPNAQLFLTAGASSNIYVKETNNYLTRLNGVQEHHRAVYHDVSCSFICLAQVSAGYEHPLGQYSRWRIEPYLKIPLRKVGMGSVPVLSMGLNVALINFTGRK